jgi:hypothetical protein
MTDVAHSRVSSRPRSHVNEQRLCQALVHMTSVFFIPVVVVRRVIGATKASGSTGAKLSIFAESRARASAIIPFIFMG